MIIIINNNFIFCIWLIYFHIKHLAFIIYNYIFQYFCSFIWFSRLFFHFDWLLTLVLVSILSLLLFLSMAWYFTHSFILFYLLFEKFDVRTAKALWAVTLHTPFSAVFKSVFYFFLFLYIFIYIVFRKAMVGLTTSVSCGCGCILCISEDIQYIHICIFYIYLRVLYIYSIISIIINIYLFCHFFFLPY